jgi:4-amino-4-deoxy-L-arabinose transferase-like glycosyltransferase
MAKSKFVTLGLVLLTLLWFSFIGHRDLIEPDEARYSEIPREMVATGDWMTPRLDGFKYFEKPALQYWMTAISFELFGQSNASARLWLVVGAFLCALFVGFLASRLAKEEESKKQGLYAFVMSLTMLEFVIFGQILTLDMSLTLFITVATGSLIIAQQNRDKPVQNRNWMLIGWAAMGLAVLTKGLIGIVLPGGAVFFYMLWQRDWQIFKHLHIIKGIIVLLIVTAPWFVAVSRLNPEFAHFFFIHEHFQRYLTTVHHRTGPLFYFIPIFLLGAAPWLMTSLSALFKPDFSWRAKQGAEFEPTRFMWVYIVVIFVFFSLGDSKLPAYILPIFPFVAILAAQRLAQWKQVKGEHWVLGGLGVIFLIAGIIITRFTKHHMPAALLVEYRPWVIAGALVMLAGAFGIKKWSKQPDKALIIGGLSALLGFQLLLAGFQTLSPSRSAAIEAEVINKTVAPTVPVYTVETYPQSLPFYLKRTVKIVEYKGELAMGIDAEPKHWLPNVATFRQAWEQQKQAVAVMDIPTYEKLLAEHFPMTLLHRGIRRVVVIKHK